MENAKSLVFEYFFQIGSGLAAGITCVIVPIVLVYRIITNKLNARRKGMME